MEFVTEREKNKEPDQYYIVIECPELYGENFFKKRIKYNLTLSKEYKKLEAYFSKNNISSLMKKKNLYICEIIQAAK